MTDEPVNRQELKSRSVHGAAISVTNQLIKLCLLFGNQILMARLLSPSDFGLVAMIAPIMAFVVLFADLGVTQATMSRPKITQEELSFLFWVNFFMALTLAIVVMALSPLAGAFYGEPRVVPIMVVMGSTFLLSGLFSQHMALFTRNMEFRKIAFMDIGSLTLAMAAGGTAALCGLQYWSLVIVHLSLYFINLFNAWTFSTWRPDKPALCENWKSLLGMGGNLSGFNFVNYFARNLDNVLIGRVSGEVQLGLYDRAYKLLLMPINQINQPFGRIVYPLLSRTLGEPDIYKKAYMKVLQVAMLVTYPGVLYAVIDHDNFLVTLLGEKWRDVGPLFAILGLGSFLSTISNSTGWLFISQDRTREMRNWGVVSATLIISSFFAGLPWGPKGVATAYVIVTTFQGPMVWWAATRKGPVTFYDLLKMLIPYIIALIVSGISIILLTNYVLPKGIWCIVVMLPVSYLIFIAAFCTVPRGRDIIHELGNHAFTFFVVPLSKLRPRPIKIEDEPL